MKKWKKYIYAIALFVVLGLTVGFAALVSEMSISNLVAEVRAKADIRISEVSFVSDQSNNIVSNDLNYSVNSIISNVTFNDSSSYITYKVKVTNIGSVEMGILEITGLHEDLSYTLADYQLEEKICDSSNNCSLGILKEFYIKIYPSADNTPITYDMKLALDFQSFNTITYDGITNNGYPTEIINGGDLVVTFTEDIPKSVAVYLDNEKISSSLYSYSDGGLNFNDVTGNIKIKATNPDLELYNIISLQTNGVDTNIDFGSASSETNGDGVNTVSGTEDDEYPIYYYRGAVANNNVLFAGVCWKAVRTTETGGVKLIYNGTPTGTQCNGTSPSIGTSAFNTNYDTEDDVRYIYEDGTDSTIKGVIDAWYGSNLTTYASYLEDTVWCSDRSVYNTDSSENIYYGAYGRNYISSSPSLSCDSEYSMTTSSTTVGNKMKYPVALLTADELTLAGTGGGGYSEDSYLSNGDYWWSLSPYYFSTALGYVYVFAVPSVGSLYPRKVLSASGIRPAVSLIPNIEILSGNGTSTNPYNLDQYIAPTGIKIFATNSGMVYQFSISDTSSITTNIIYKIYYADSYIGSNTGNYELLDTVELDNKSENYSYTYDFTSALSCQYYKIEVYDTYNNLLQSITDYMMYRENGVCESVGPDE